MPISRSHDESRPENFRVDELGEPPPKTAKTGPIQDPVTHRFVKGGGGGPGRKKKDHKQTLKQHSGRLGSLDPTTCEEWLRPWVIEAHDHAEKLIGELPFKTPELCAVATELSEARAVRAALLSLASQGDKEARAEARAWNRECRQHQIALRGLINQEFESRRLAAEDASDRARLLVRGEDGAWSPASGPVAVGSVCRSPVLSALIAPRAPIVVVEDKTLPAPLFGTSSTPPKGEPS